MKRDLVFSVEILSFLEELLDPLGADHYDILTPILGDADSLEESERTVMHERLIYHIDILESAGFIRRNSQADDATVYYALTWAGHDYLDGSIR